MFGKNERLEIGAYLLEANQATRRQYYGTAMVFCPPTLPGPKTSHSVSRATFAN